MNLIGIDAFRAQVKAKRKPDGGVFRVSVAEPKAFDDASRKVRFCFSDGSVDRMGDTIDPQGWETASFMRNPVALWAHDSSEPPIGRASDVGPEGNRLMGDIEFVPPETYAFADTIYRLVVGRFINAVSVGFIPLEYSFVENDPDRGWGIDFKRQELLEISVCPVPANGNALADARAKGIDTRPLVEWAERTLDAGGKIIIPRAELERLRKAAQEPPMTRRTPKKPRLRADGANEDDPTAGGAIVGNCGRGADQECGMKDPDECSIHGSAKTVDDQDTDDDKALMRALRRLLNGRRRDAEDGDPDNSDEPPTAHEDAIRLAHKCLRTSKAFLTEAVTHHAKAMSFLDDVVDALNADGESGDDDTRSEEDPDNDGDPDADPEKAARLRRAQARRKRIVAV